MSRLEERETIALSSLHDISDYSNYIDQRISKLNNLYQSLTISPKKQPPHSLPHRSLHRQPHEHAPPTDFQTLQHHTLQSFHGFNRDRLQPSPEQMNRTDYPRRERYALDQKAQIYADLKSLTVSNFANSLDFSRTRLPKHQERKPSNKKLEIYKQIKNEMLGTFYVGGRTLSQPRGEAKQILEGARGREQQRVRRGKLWHGRPPVKIIEKFD